MRVCADRSGFSFGEWRTVIAREELSNALLRPFDIVGITCITSVSGGGAVGRSVAIAQKQCGAPKAGPGEQKGVDSAAAYCMR
jgi:hypothetical protein